jgi:hypothetical protein
MIQPTITGILERFDFEKVRALMLINNWTWMGEKESPTVERMKDTVDNLYITVLNSRRPNTRVGTGGFILSRWEWDDSVELELSFVWQRTSDTVSKEL